MKDELTVSGIKKFLNFDSNIILKNITESTNTDAKLLAVSGAGEGTLVVSKMQTAGRGRMNRLFFSPDESGIYMTLILRPVSSGESSLLITTAAAVAVSEAIESILGVHTDIKWVNDIYLEGRKICGILAESVFSGEENFCVLGIGINVYPPAGGFPDDIKDKAGYLCESFKVNLKNRLIAEIVNIFMSYYSELEKKTYLKTYKEKNMLKGKFVEVPGKGKAKVIDIDEKFHLVVEYPNKTKEALMTGEVIINL